MAKISILLLLFYYSLSSAQKSKIIDSETKNPISNARVISREKVYYSNEDGFVLLPEKSDDLVISANGYETLKEATLKPIIDLKPRYNPIDEVKIVSVDFQKILKEVAKNYEEIYYNKPIIYEVTIKQKSFENNRLKMLMVADGKFWSRNGTYNARDAYRDKFDQFVQLQIDELRYLKSEPSQNTVKTKNPLISHDQIGDLFLSYELWRTHALSKMKNAKVSGRLLYENGDEQEISYSIQSDSSLVYNGKFTYNKKDKAISHFELDFTQNKAAPRIFKDQNGKEFKSQLGDGLIMFDYFKKGDRYFPSKISYTTRGFKIFNDSQSFEYSSEKEFIFKSFERTEKSGLDNPVKINQAYWKNLKVSSEKGNLLLTKEEQNFVDRQDTNQNKNDKED